MDSNDGDNKLIPILVPDYIECPLRQSTYTFSQSVFYTLDK